MENILRDTTLAQAGTRKIAWVRQYMPLLRQLEEEFKRDLPLRGVKLSLSVHLEAKTAYLAQVLAAGGAQVAATGSNPLSTQDDVAAGLAASGVAVYALHAATPEEYMAHLKMALEFGPNIVVDDGGDLVHLLHGELAALQPNVWGGCEETTTGVLRLRARAKENKLAFPMVSVNDATCKYLFDNRYGTGQSVFDGIMRTTNLIIAGKNVVVAGYGWCGKGVAAKAKGLGARVIVTEVDPVKALEAVMDGFHVMPMDEAAKQGDLFITVTGNKQVIVGRHFDSMKDGAILCNAGHFDVEIWLPELAERAVEQTQMRHNIQGYRMKDGRLICVLAEGRLVNLASGDGHPAEIMDTSFALQALCVRYLVENHTSMPPDVYAVPVHIDQRVARMRLQATGHAIDTLTAEQKAYLESYEG